jgi:hypothetical protein
LEAAKPAQYKSGNKSRADGKHDIRKWKNGSAAWRNRKRERRGREAATMVVYV